MIENKRVLALIPARAGSKRVKGKNIRAFNGEPLIAWTINAALNSKYLDLVALSSDCEQSKEIASRLGVAIPFTRPHALATDTASSVDVALHALTHYANDKEHFDLLILLQVTSPLRTPGDIDAAIELYAAKEAKAVVSVSATNYPPAWTGRLGADLAMDEFIAKCQLSTRSQDLEAHYGINGAIYIIDVAGLTATRSFFPDQGCYAYIMPRARAVDIDDEFDFQLAELIAANYSHSSIRDATAPQHY